MCGQQSSGVDTVVAPLKRLLREFDLRESEGRREFLGFPFRDFINLNNITSGLRSSHLTLLATTASNLRSQFLLQMVISVIDETKVPVLFMCFETSPEVLISQTLSRYTRLSMDTILSKKIKSNANLKEALKGGLEKISKFQSYLHLVGGSQNDTIDQIEVYIQELKQRYKTDKVIVVIDSLQRIPCYNFHSSWAERISDSANRLKILANSHRIAVLAGSEISKDGELIEMSDNKQRLEISHCLGCDDLGRYADNILTASKSWIDNNDLENLLKQKAEASGYDVSSIPALKVIDVFCDKLGSESVIPKIVQFLALPENGILMELGQFSDQVLVRQNRIDKALTHLIDEKVLRFDAVTKISDNNFSKSHQIDGARDKSAVIDNLANSENTKRIKPSIKLNR